MILPQGSYGIELTGAGGSGTTSYNLTSTTGHELIYRKYDMMDRVVQIGEYVSTSASGNFTQANAENIAFPTSSQVAQHTFYYDDPAPLATYPLASDQRSMRGRVSYVQSFRLGLLAQTALYSYDDLGRIEWISYYNLGSVPKKLKYTYDLQGRVVKKEYIDLQTSANNLFTYYEYDQVGRLTKVLTNHVDNPGTANKEAEYSWPCPRKLIKLSYRIKVMRAVEMSKKRHSVETIITKLREAEVLAAKGEQVPEICRQIGVTEQTYLSLAEGVWGRDAGRSNGCWRHWQCPRDGRARLWDRPGRHNAG